jgi:rhodanese-related sulfurtransferase
MPGALVSYFPMNTRRRVVNLACVLATGSGVCGCRTIDENSVDAVRVSPESLNDRLESDRGRFLIVDARPQAAFDEGHLPGAVRMDPNDLDPSDPDPKFGSFKAVIVYGEDPRHGRANALTKRFLEAGISVQMLDGGMHGWRRRGFPVEGSVR